MKEAEKKEINDPNALSLATTDSQGRSDVRIVLLKELSSKGFVFYTNLNSSKSNDLKKNPKAAMCFYWKSLRRQIRILGTVNQVNDSEADTYFNTRSYGSKIGAWASNQSSSMNNTKELIDKIEIFKKKYNDKNVPRPEFWSGWRLNPNSIEFWLSGENRIHERLKYYKKSEKWVKEILYP